MDTISDSMDMSLENLGRHEGEELGVLQFLGSQKSVMTEGLNNNRKRIVKLFPRSFYCIMSKCQSISPNLFHVQYSSSHHKKGDSKHEKQVE